MQEQQPQEAGMATPTSEPSTATPSTNNGPKPPIKQNRKQRRALQAFDRKMKSYSKMATKDRLDCFHHLTAWKDRESQRKNRMTDEQINSVFRVALARLFKGKEIIRKRKKVLFPEQLTAIVRNVKKGFKYKSDVAPAAAPLTPTPETAVAPAEG